MAQFKMGANNFATLDSFIKEQKVPKEEMVENPSEIFARILELKDVIGSEQTSKDQRLVLCKEQRSLIKEYLELMANKEY